MMMKLIRVPAIVAGALSLLVVVPASAGASPDMSAPSAPAPAPFSFDAAPGRLPKNVVPLSYFVSLVPNAAELKFSGSESVQLQFRSATATVVFNSVNETLRNVRLDGKPVKSVATDVSHPVTTV